MVTELAAELDMDVFVMSGIGCHPELDKNGISVTEVLVLEKPGGKTEVNIHNAACGGNRECLKKVEAIVSQVLGKAMSRRHRDCTRAGKSDCTLHLSETRKYEIITGVARQPRHDSSTCGDSYSFTSVKDGKYMLALSDGMGSGARAAEESSAVISLMENFMEAGLIKILPLRLLILSSCPFQERCLLRQTFVLWTW